MSDPVVQPEIVTPPATEGAPDTAPQGKTFTQAELDQIVKDRLERQKRATEAAATKAADDAKAAMLKEQGDYKALYEAGTAKIAELARQAEAAARYEAALSKTLEQQRKDLPAHITALLDSMDVAAQLEYLSEHGDKLRTPPVAETTAPPRGTPRIGAAVPTTTPTPTAPVRREPTVRF
jgi:hypothetical protein